MKRLERNLRDAELTKYLRGNKPAPMPKAPPELDEVGAGRWAELVDAAADGIDLDLLTLYCSAWSRWKAADAKVQELGTVIKSPSGYPVISPYLSIANRAAMDLLKISRRLQAAIPKLADA